MKDLTWFDPGQSLEAEELTGAQSRLGVKFPGDYSQVVKSHSGASNPDYSEFEYDDHGLQRIGNFGILLNLRPGDPESIFEVMDNLSDQLPSKVIPIVDTGSGDCVCLDYRNSNVPKIVYFSHERIGDQSLLPLANSFSDFIGLLREPID